MAMAVARAARSSLAVITITFVFGETRAEPRQHFQAGYAIHPEASPPLFRLERRMTKPMYVLDFRAI